MREGGNREEEGRERLGPLAAAATPIVIYDKYVGVQSGPSPIYGRKFGDGLTWLMGHRAAPRPQGPHHHRGPTRRQGTRPGRRSA